MVRVTAEVWIIPGSPALVRELAPSDGASARLLAACRALAKSEAAGRGRCLDVVCSQDERWSTEHTGSFRAWGAPQVQVRGGNVLGELVARYALGDPRVREVRGEIGRPDPDAVTVLVVDGPAGLTDRAPLALVDGAPQQHERLCGWLGGAPAGVDKHMPGVLEPQLWHELANLAPTRAELIDHDDTLGVGRYVAVWQC